jgi:hypothetical protein
MKKILSLIALLSITLSASAQTVASNITWGSAAAPGGSYWWENGVALTQIDLGYFADDDTSNAFSIVATHTGGQGLGLLFGTTAASYDASVIGLTAYVKVGSGENYISRDTWIFSGNESPTPPSTEDWSIADADGFDNVIGGFDFISPGGFQDAGQTINAVPEPSTYALIAGFAAFLLVAIRRRK